MRYRKQPRRRPVMPPAWHYAMAAHRERDEARRIALPERAPDPRPGEVLHDWQMVSYGRLYRVQAMVPPDVGAKRARSDRFVVVVDGTTLPEVIGLTDIMDHLRTKVLPRPMSRKERYEADRISEMGWSEPA